MLGTRVVDAFENLPLLCAVRLLCHWHEKNRFWGRSRVGPVFVQSHKHTNTRMQMYSCAHVHTLPHTYVCSLFS